MLKSLVVTMAIALPNATAAQTVLACDGWQASAQQLAVTINQATGSIQASSWR